MSEATTRRKRILLGQLAARGDCLYATAIARQIKADNEAWGKVVKAAGVKAE